MCAMHVLHMSIVKFCSISNYSVLKYLPIEAIIVNLSDLPNLATQLRVQTTTTRY